MPYYFECNIPEKAPDYLHAEARLPYLKLSRMIHDRFNVLNEALDVTGMRGEDFAATAKKIFDINPAQFDTLDAIQLAETVRLLYDGSHQPDRIVWPNVETIIDCDFVTTKEWEAIRRLSIGGSEVAVLLGCSPYTLERELYYDKTGTPVTVQEDEAKEGIFLRGHILEDAVIGQFCKNTGAVRIKESRMFRNKKYPHASCNIDALLQMPDGTLRIFEAKTAKREKYYDWTGDKIPENYVAQAQHYHMVMDDPRIAGAYIGCLFTEDCKVGEIYAGSTWNEKEFISHKINPYPYPERRLNMIERWWKTYVEENETPPLTETPAHAKKAESGYAHTVAEIIRMPLGDLDPALPVVNLNGKELSDVCSEWIRLHEQQRKAEATVKEIKSQKELLLEPVITAMGCATRAVVTYEDETFSIDNKVVNRRTVDYDKLEESYPDAAKDCIKVKQSSGGRTVTKLYNRKT